MSVSELKGHIEEPPLGGESGPGLAACEDDEDEGCTDSTSLSVIQSNFSVFF